MSDMPEMIDGWPNFCGEEKRVAEAVSRPGPYYLTNSRVDFQSIQSALGIALHMQQPLVPVGGNDLKTAEIISNLKHMMDNQGIGDNHNAPVFHWCYKRIGEFVPELVGQGKSPRVMLDYSGCLFHGLPKMGLWDVIDSLRGVTNDHYSVNVEWLGCTWGHAVAPSTPVQDYRLQVKAWQHHFAALFGLDALARVRGFSPAEMALPNHPDVAFEFVKTLKDCGFLWVMLQEHSIEDPETGQGSKNPYLPNRLICRNSQGEETSIIALVKTQGSDTKLVAQMQPFYEAKAKQRVDLGGKSLPPYVCQIGDGENGGVMMNEFPGMFRQAMSESSGSGVPAMNGTEYLEHASRLGFREEDYPAVSPKWTKLLFEHFKPGDDLTKAIEECKKADNRFNMEGGSWTNNISWTQGYENVLGPMEKASALFAEKTKNLPTSDIRYRKALFHLLCSQTSCYRYWGQGVWTDYGAEICRRAIDVLNYDI
ncbi:MAG: glycosyl hydrolase family 57 [Planctomycetes bacterium]|nr:glycosyl hydrolase family 57 [Planctomycetota bacterium]